MRVLSGGGTSLDKLRPRGASVNNAAKTTTGAVSFMEKFNTTSNIIGSENRRAALMISLNVEHPDIEEFIEKKLDLDAITKANISVEMTDEFMQAVVNEEKFDLHFHVEDTGEEIIKTVDANKVMNMIAYANYDYAEPGILFKDTIERWSSNSDLDTYEYGGVNPLTYNMGI